VLYRNEASFKILRPLISKTARHNKTQKLKRAHNESSLKKGEKKHKTEKKFTDSAEIATQVLVSSCVYNLPLAPMVAESCFCSGSGSNLHQISSNSSLHQRKLAFLYSEEDRASSPTITGQTRFLVYPVSNRHSRMTGYCK
jgi:hypothetical protein